MTEKIYDLDSYNKEFDATVIQCQRDGEWYQVILDRSAFFPREGGQTADLGTIDGHEVVDVILSEENIIHTLTGPVLVHSRVSCQVDWTHRFRNMQMHSGEHIFSGVVHDLYGYHNVGFHLSENSATMDFDGRFQESDLDILEERVNQIIQEGHEIRGWYPTKDELSVLDYRSKKEITGPVRLVQIEDVDVCACCAPHVRNTIEIGLFKISSAESYKGGTRIHYLCGQRAFEDYKRKQNLLNQMGRLLSVGEDTLYNNLKELKDNLRTKEEIVIRMKQEIAFREIDMISEEQVNGIWITEEADPPLMKVAVKHMQGKHSGFCGVFAGNDVSGYRYFVESRNGGLERVNQLLRKEYHAKGGGSDMAIQGNVRIKKEEISSIFG